ncbi:Sensor protein qseC [Serratia odorifera]|uniref:histidine kinase n=1 Tax=Serratia odorifera TaxID=618 RepID=A0A3S4DZV6_SEROD|nr:Sensor protein qseC [Serratia odorifera]
MLLRERRFTSDAAHELRSPLAALRVQTEVVQLAGDDVAMRERAVENLSVSIDRATRLVDQLLTLSRLDALPNLDGQAPVDWGQLVPATLAEQEHHAHQAGVTLRYQPQGAPSPRSGDGLLLSLLVRNLLDNAVRYTPTGSAVTVTLNAAELRVEDEGPGVTTQHLARLGERFYRPPGQEQTGSGLGVSIVQRIADLHGLRVSFANRREGGICRQGAVLA